MKWNSKKRIQIHPPALLLFRYSGLILWVLFVLCRRPPFSVRHSLSLLPSGINNTNLNNYTIEIVLVGWLWMIKVALFTRNKRLWISKESRSFAIKSVKIAVLRTRSYHTIVFTFSLDALFEAFLWKEIKKWKKNQKLFL